MWAMRATSLTFQFAFTVSSAGRPRFDALRYPLTLREGQEGLRLHGHLLRRGCAERVEPRNCTSVGIGESVFARQIRHEMNPAGFLHHFRIGGERCDGAAYVLGRLA